MSYPFFDRSTAPPYQAIFDYGSRTDGQPVFIGWATPGAKTSSKVWMIRKFIYSVTTPANVLQILFANGDAGFQQQWDPNGAFGSYNGGATFK